MRAIEGRLSRRTVQLPWLILSQGGEVTDGGGGKGTSASQLWGRCTIAARGQRASLGRRHPHVRRNRAVGGPRLLPACPRPSNQARAAPSAANARTKGSAVGGGRQAREGLCSRAGSRSGAPSSRSGGEFGCAIPPFTLWASVSKVKCPAAGVEFQAILSKQELSL